ncbi:MAG: hypothetical protein F6K54_31880 [Okeania sp. SIO3B5]|uniref:hypothetical protein n=1 Tax=Okeania sp. SIO3B5 TaxID=2607811 RepID=UPI001400C09E|nr:hypothetical protein [Okeania sp. SIO3B5]NEO57265.1 hypothetical protein [Okeania sp. SIO3B5]
MSPSTTIKNKQATGIYHNLVIESSDFLDLVHRLSQFSVIFPLEPGKIYSTVEFLEPFLKSEVGLSIKFISFNQELNFICCDAIAENLLIELKRHTLIIFFNRQVLLGEYSNQQSLLWAKLDCLGYKVFFNHSFDSANTYPQNYSFIDIFELTVSSKERLTNFPSISGSLWQKAALSSQKNNPSCIFILDLIQDFEVLIPIIKTIASQFHGFKIKVLFTKRFSSFPITNSYLTVLQVLNVAYYPVETPYEVIDFFKKNDVLFTSSESSVSGHSFGHTVCKILGSSVLKLTVQHGYENVGLNHHKAHNLQLPDGVRFASDFIFTWNHPSKYSNIYPTEINKCIPVGVIKSIANDSFQYRSLFHDPNLTNSQSIVETKNNKFQLLLGENLHSVRFKDQTPVHKYLQFIDYLNSSSKVELTVRCHPGKRWLEVNKIFEGITFYNDVLSISRLSSFQGIISPPSTFILDAILCNIPVCIWTVDDFGVDTINYPLLPLVSNVNSFWEFVSMSTNSYSKVLYNQLSFLAKNTVSFNGTNYLISRLLGFYSQI